MFNRKIGFIAFILGAMIAVAAIILLQQNEESPRQNDVVTRSAKGSFPASDPPGWTGSGLG